MPLLGPDDIGLILDYMFDRGGARGGPLLGATIPSD